MNNYMKTNDETYIAAKAILEGKTAAQQTAVFESAMAPELDEAPLKQTSPTKENKVRLAAFMKKLNALRNEFPDVVIRGTHDEEVEARLLGDDGNIVQYLGMEIDFVHKA